jgi:F-type H+-transporting ATPase subunit epsilon
MAEQLLKVRLVTPDRILVDHTADAVEVPGQFGCFEVFYGHAPLISNIGAGELRIHGGTAGEQRYLVARGFVEVLPERVTIMAEVAQKPEEIDADAAVELLQRGEHLRNEAGQDPDKYARASALIAEAEAKLEMAGAGKSS